jgi:cell division protein FtsQ
VRVKRRLSVRLRLALAALSVVAGLGGGWVWLRDSPLVAVRRVTIVGVAGADAGQIRSALTLAARNMTTLDVRLAQLRMAVAPYPVVKDVRASAQFPHGMRIQVIEQVPVGALQAGGRSVAASADGTVLRDVAAASLPEIPVKTLPGGSQVTDPTALSALALLSSAPARLFARISRVTTNYYHGLVVQLRSGPAIYFGDASAEDAKWAAATQVLADPSSAGASYIDVTDPAHPAAGVGAQAVAAAGLASTGSTTSGSSAGSTGSGYAASSTGSVAPGSTGSTLPAGAGTAPGGG